MNCMYRSSSAVATRDYFALFFAPRHTVVAGGGSFVFEKGRDNEGSRRVGKPQLQSTDLSTDLGADWGIEPKGTRPTLAHALRAAATPRDERGENQADIKLASEPDEGT